jgi:hypothetical protein
LIEQRAPLTSRLADQGDVERTLRQIQVLLRFVTAVTAQLAGRPCDQAQVEALVQQLILLGSAVKSASLHQTEAGQLVYSATGGAMQLLSAEKFLVIIARLLDSEGSQVSISLLQGNSSSTDQTGYQGRSGNLCRPITAHQNTCPIEMRRKHGIYRRKERWAIINPSISRH